MQEENEDRVLAEECCGGGPKIAAFEAEECCGGGPKIEEKVESEEKEDKE